MSKRENIRPFCHHFQTSRLIAGVRSVGSEQHNQDGHNQPEVCGDHTMLQHGSIADVTSYIHEYPSF